MRLRWVLRVGAALLAAVVLYVGVTFVQVWQASRRDGAQAADAVVVLGAAQYDGRPSPVLRARLDHAAGLYDQGLARVVVVTGGRQLGDRHSEAEASARYLLNRHHVPETAVLWEPYGRSSWEQIAAAGRFLKQRGMDEVILVSDPFHAARVAGIAGEQGLAAVTSPTRTSPIGGMAQAPYLAKEAVAVAAGRLVGYRRVAWLVSHR